MSGSLHRLRALQLYKRLIRLSQSWIALDHPAKTDDERKYILRETRQLFRQNQHVNDPEQIEEHLREGQARLELACHYGNPYPRPVNLPTYSLPPNRNRIRFKSEYEAEDMSRPIYLKSYEVKEEEEEEERLPPEK